MIRPFAAMVVAGVGLLAAGCSDSERTMVPVTGTVTYNNQPVAGAQVTFTPVTGVTAFATTDAQGKYSLATLRDGEGAEPGKYTVTVRKGTETAAPMMPGITDNAAATSTTGQTSADAPKPTERPSSETLGSESLIPEIYGNLTQTPLRDYEVKAGGPNVFDIVLDDSAQPFAELPTAVETFTSPEGSSQ